MTKRNLTEILIGILAVFSIILVAVESLADVSAGMLKAIYIADGVICCVFAWDFIIRLKASESKSHFLKTSGFEVLAMIPAVAFYALGAIPAISTGFRSLRLVRVVIVFARMRRVMMRSGGFLKRSNLVAVASEGERLGEVLVPHGKVGLATVSSVVVNGSFLKAGIPIASRFGGILQIRNNEPLRFIDLIEYDGSTLDPYEIFIAGRMTNVTEASKHGAGKILASFHEIPMPSKLAVLEVIDRLKSAGLCNEVILEKPSGLVCEVPVQLNNVGLLLFSGLNPVAAAAEAGINVTCKPMSGVVDIQTLRNFHDL